jgi:hypothetical protein
MARRAYTRTLKTGKVVSVKASFGSSPNRAPGKIMHPVDAMRLWQRGHVQKPVAKKEPTKPKWTAEDDHALFKLHNRMAWDNAAHENYGA